MTCKFKFDIRPINTVFEHLEIHFSCTGNAIYQGYTDQYFNQTYSEGEREALITVVVWILKKGKSFISVVI